MSLLARRASSALHLGRELRALADTSIALKLGGGLRSKMLRSRALMHIGAFAAAEHLLAPHATTGSLSQRLAVSLLREAARARGASVPQRIGVVVDAANETAPLPRELAYVHGGLCMRSEMGGGKGRGWVATEDIVAGTLLLAEPATFPTVGPQLSDAEEDTLPLLQAVTGVLRRDGLHAEQLKEYLACMCPLDGDGDEVASSAAPTTLRDTLAAPYVDAIGTAAGMTVEATRSLDRKLQRNQMGLKLRVGGELADFGSGVFPFAAIFNHACHPHAQWRPLASGSAIIVRALRDIRAGEEVSVSYLPLGTVGRKRKTHLLEQYGFVCTCERCTAPPGSPLFERERWEFALVCPHCPHARREGGGEGGGGSGGGGGDGSGSNNGSGGGACGTRHALLPNDPYDENSAYRCIAAGCEAMLSADQARAHLRKVLDSFVGLHAHLSSRPLPMSCLAARASEALAREYLMPHHHEWMAWTTAVMVIAEAADDEELLLAAYRKCEAALVPDRVEDADVFIRLNHALVADLDTEEAAQLLRQAYELDRAASGVGVEGWIARWVPDDLDISDDVRRILSAAR